MALLSLVRVSVGSVSVSPGDVRMITTDDLATITTAGYLQNTVNSPATAIGLLPSDVIECLYSYDTSTGLGTLAFLQPNFSSGIFTLNVWENPGNVLLPVVSGNFAVFNGIAGQIKDAGYLPTDATKTKVIMAGSAVQVGYLAHFIDTLGTIDDTAGAVTNAGNISAGLAGTPGTFISFPATSGNGTLIVAAVNAGGAFNTTISNTTMGQSSVITIPDPGAATANFILSAATTTQTIGTGISITGNNNVQTTGGGNFLAGSSGLDGIFVSYPATALNGSLILAAADAGADFDMTISNTTLGQDTVVTIVDPVNAAARFLVAATATPFISGNLPQASGTGGLMIDSGVAVSGLQILSASVSLNQADVQGAYGTPVQIIAAVPNKVIVPVQATIYTNFQTSAFADGGVVVLQYDNTVNGAGTNSLAATIPAAEITAGASQIYSEAGVISSALTAVTNKGLYLSNQTGAFTGGDAASTVVVTVSYYLVTATV